MTASTPRESFQIKNPFVQKVKKTSFTRDEGRKKSRCYHCDELGHHRAECENFCYQEEEGTKQDKHQYDGNESSQEANQHQDGVNEFSQTAKACQEHEFQYASENDYAHGNN